MNDLWKEICFTLHDISASSSEELYEQKIIQSLEKLGWSRFREEIILKPNFQLGSSGSIKPDILVKLLEGNESFVIEVKKPSADIDNNSHKNQLFSYMRQLKLIFGLLIGNKIQIYYDGLANNTEWPILLKSIDISEKNQEGLIFIELFKKDSFSYRALECYAEKIITELATENHKQKLIELLVRSDYQGKIREFIINDLQQNWDNETIESVLGQVHIQIDYKANLASEPPSLHSQDEAKIGRLVKSYINQIVNYCENSEQELANLQSKEYSKKTFDINFPFLKKDNSIEQEEKKRYWKEKYLIRSEYYFVTSQWFAGSRSLFESYIAKITNTAR